MEKLIPKEFDLLRKERSEESQRLWRKAVRKLVKNRRCRFRYAADLEKRSEAKEQMRKLRDNIRVCFVVYSAALRFIDGSVLGKRFIAEDGKNSSESPEQDTGVEIQNGLTEEDMLAG
ncbi:calcium-transporting ATPase 1, plasma membrane-type-like [Primulina tabacum]|uniref:calcium-transporting ATPase 1, plasma membrane-type-like n=1 Tax=Primulina tabacum TaxID=48773 RepID=UPI003F5A8D61